MSEGPKAVPPGGAPGRRPGPRAPVRIVSLVPSLTEALFALGLGTRLIGVTEWCVHPAAGVAKLPKLGGTKDPDVDAIVALRPDLVIANREENTKRAVEALRAARLEVWVTEVHSVREGTRLLRELADIGASTEAVARVVLPVEAALARAERERPGRPARFFCPIWKQPWMSVGDDTYAGDLLTLCGGENVFAGRGERRYPIVSDAEIRAAAPAVIVLPDEPYAFGARDVADLARLETPAAETGRIHLIDGTLVSWYGPRIARAIETLRSLFAGG